MDTPFNWKPKDSLLKKLLILARQRDRTPEELVTEAVELYLETQQSEIENSQSDDPLIGLFKGSPDLATQSEEILKEDITEQYRIQKPLMFVEPYLLEIERTNFEDLSDGKAIIQLFDRELQPHSSN